MSTPVALSLAIRQWLARPLRPILCSIAIAAAVALIVCVGATFESLRYSIDTVIGQMLGVAEIHIRPAQKGVDARLPDSLLQQVRQRPDVELAAGRLQTHVSLTFGSGDEDRRWFDAIGISPKLDERLRPQIYSAGHGLTGGGNEVVIDSTIADLMHLRLGDKLQLSADGEHYKPVTVVGIIKRPAIELLSRPTLYVDIDALAKDLGSPLEYNVIDLKLRDSANVSDYDAYAKWLNKQLGPSVVVSPGTNSRAKLTQETRSIQLILSLLAVISSICAALIIGTTLSVGVQERIRQFGQLRCIGSSRSQLATFVLADALVMGLIGSLIGIVLGFLFSSLLVVRFPQFFLAYRIAASSIVIAAVTGILATLLGACIPMWQVARVSPMAAITAVATPPRRSRIWLAAAVGFLCLAAQALLWIFSPGGNLRFFSYMFLGIPLIFVGWAFIGPALLVVTEWAGAHLIGRLLFIRPVLLRSAWSRTPWRASAMIAALMIGVTLLTAVRARGQSLLISWVSPARLPDLLLYNVMDSVVDSFVPKSVLPSPEKRAEELRAQYPQITDVAPAASFPVKFRGNIFKIGDIVSGDLFTRFVAVDPVSFPRLVEMEFIQGDRDTALRELAAGGHIFVTEDFYNARHLGVGDKLTLIAADGKPVDFAIAAVVTSTGMELVKNYFDMRTIFAEQAVSSVLGTLADAHKYFRVREASFLLVNVVPSAQTPEAMAALRRQLAKDGYQAVSSIELKRGIRNIITRVVDALSLIAVGALIVASLGVANMVIASVHARRYEFGILRAVGAGRFQLIRLVLAEVTLIGIIAGILGVAAGLQLAYMSTLVDRLLTGFRTNFLALHTPGIFLNALLYVAVGILITTLLAWLAAIAPAARAALTAQRTLLASGRA